MLVGNLFFSTCRQGTSFPTFKQEIVFLPVGREPVFHHPIMEQATNLGVVLVFVFSDCNFHFFLCKLRYRSQEEVPCFVVVNHFKLFSTYRLKSLFKFYFAMPVICLCHIGVTTLGSVHSSFLPK